VNGDTAAVITGIPSISTTANSGSAAGTYPITVAAGTVAAANYTFNFIVGVLTVTRAQITITADPKTRAYGVANPAFTYTPSGFVNGDTASVITGTPSLTSTATVSSTAGTYPITAATGSLAATNYTFAFSAGTLTVNQANLVITADAQSRTYGVANPAFTYTPSGFVNGDTASVLTGTPSLNTTATLTSPAGAYTITAAAGTLAAVNYTLSFVDGVLNIGKAVITITADPKSRGYGAANPTLTYTASGFVNGDTTSVINGSPALTTSAVAASPVGPYAITAATGTLSATNYAFTFSPGVLTVSQAVLNIGANSAARNYGTANPVFTYTPSGFVNGDTASVLGGAPALSSTATISSAAGTYPITAALGSLTATNYGFSFTPGTLTVNAAVLTITADAKSRAYGVANPTFTYTPTGFVNGDTASILSGAPAFSTTATILSGAATYPITVTQGSLAASGYSFIFVNGALTVTSNGTAVSLASSANPSILGSPITFTASLTGSGTVSGTVTFKDGATTLGSGTIGGGSATFSTAALALGSHSITAVYSGDTVSDGNGQFHVASTITADSNAAIISGDFNGDGKNDIAVADNSGPGSVTILLGDGTGNFTAASGSPFVVSSPSSVAVGDFNHDGAVDLAVTNSSANTISVLLGNGNGSFASAAHSPFATGTNPIAIATGDFDGDGKLDLATANLDAKSLTIFTGDGTGNFAAASNSPVALSATPVALSAGAVAGKRTGLAVANQNGTITVLQSGSTGSFSEAIGSPVPVSTSLASMVLGDFDNDGKPDFAALDATSNSLFVKLNRTTSFSTVVVANIAVAASGPQTVTENYSGDSVYPASVSNAVTLTSTTGADFAIVSATSSQSIAPGQSANYNITVTPQNAFTGTVDLSCSGLPAGYSCAFAPAALTLAATKGTAVMTITSTQSAAIAPGNGVLNLAVLSSIRPSPQSAFWLFSGLALFLIVLTRKAPPRRYASRMACAAVMFAAIALLPGCGGSPMTPPLSTSYTVTITGTSGMLKHSTAVTLIVKVSE
jgi:MBG domain-containing protein/Big-like domain-containing protein/VCBS repeat protein